ncbi:MAG: MFS transporter permease [Deltaproteobacteria bacterium]|nr:MAG: MFS transporter permease [Deltaproteobacteria bacterium]
MPKKIKEIVILKEQAVFWLDRNGRWHNQFGEFQHKKIIDFFHSSIRKDKDGYFVTQTRENLREKVYFHCEDGALFVFDVVKDQDIFLTLNTGKKIKLKPKKLWIEDDSLYMQESGEQVKFTERSLMKISDLIEFDGDHYFIRLRNRKYKIHQL